jgi:GxxExxY protein
MLSFEPLTKLIIGAAFRVHNALGSGYREHVYQNALAVELAKHRLKVELEAPLPVLYDGVDVGTCKADLVVEEVFAVEAKAQDALLDGHAAQLRAYLRCSGLESGLVLNFGPEKVGIRRVEDGRKSGRGERRA